VVKQPVDSENGLVNSMRPSVASASRIKRSFVQANDRVELTLRLRRVG
jgi:hypothetical protein